MPPPSQFQNQQAVQQLLQGMNTMQMRAGLMPGGMGQLPPPITPLRFGPRASDIAQQLQVQFTQQQQLIQMISPPPLLGGGVTSVRRPTGFESGMMMPGVQLPGPQFGRGRAMARQVTRGVTNEHYASAQAGMGLGFRAAGGVVAATAGMAVGSMLGPAGPMLGAAAGATAYEHFGGGQRLQNFGASMVQPFVRNRRQAMQLQNQSMQYVRGGSDLSSSGTGLSMEASTRLSSQLSQMAGSSNFQQETGGRFNRKDVMKITRLAGEMGMLEQSSTADQIKDSIGKISRSLSNFMKIAEQPDVQEAMRMMGQMRSLGMSLGQSTTAASNARSFARMAGTTTRDVMAGGMQGAGTFQRAGLSGASGMSAGMAAQGLAGQMAGLMDPRRLAMAGGVQGIAGTLTQGAARSGTMDAILPAMLRRRNGRLTIDPEQIRRMAMGEMDIGEAVQQSSRNIRRLGGRRALMELSTRRRELQDEAQSGMGGVMSTLMPLIQARMITQRVPGMTMGAALVNTGMGEQQARTYEQMVQSPEFWNRLREQQNVNIREGRNDLRTRRERTREEAHTPRILRRIETGFGDQVSRGAGASARLGGALARRTDREEEREAQGGGRVISTLDRSELDTDVQRASLRDLSRSPDGRATLREGMIEASAQVDQEVEAQERTDTGVDILRTVSPVGAEIIEEGLARYRGGDSVRATVNRSQSFGTRATRFLGLEVATSGRIQRDATSLQRVAQRFERTGLQTNEQRDVTLQRARQSVGRTVETDKDFDRMAGVAAAAINAHASDQTTLGITHGEITEESQREAIRGSLAAAGYSSAQINQALSAPEFIQNATNLGTGSRSPAAQATIDAAVERGAEVGTARRGRRARITRERADELRSDALEGIGISTGVFSSTSRDQQRAVLSAVSGTGVGANTRRSLLNIRAMEARAAEVGEDTAEGRRLTREAATALSALQQEQGSEAVTQADAELQGVTAETRRRMGERLADMTPKARAGAFTRAGVETTEAATGEASQQLTENLGEAGATALDEHGITGLRSLLESGGGDMADQERERLLTGIRSGRITEESIRTRAALEVTNEQETSVVGGLSEMAERAAQGDFGGMLASLQSFATEGGVAPTDEVALEGPQAFAEAVTTFSEASDKLLRAAEELNSSGAMAGIGQVVTAGTPLGAIQNVFGAVSGLFGGDD